MTTYSEKVRSAPPAALAAIVGACTEAEVTRVLIVEDDGDTRYAMTRLFTREGFLVDCAASVDGAVLLASQFQPDIICSDLMLAGHFGDALLDRLPPGPRFVFVTGSEDLDRLERIRQRGAAVVRKPVDVPRLLRLVRELAEGQVTK